MQYNHAEADRTTHVSWILAGDFADHQEITGMIGIAPSFAFGFGEFYYGHVDRNRKAWRRRGGGSWRLSSYPRIPSSDPGDHLRYLIELLEPRIDVIAELRARPGNRSLMNIHRVGHVGTIDYDLSAALLARLHPFSDCVSFTHLITACPAGDLDGPLESADPERSGGSSDPTG